MLQRVQELTFVLLSLSLVQYFLCLYLLFAIFLELKCLSFLNLLALVMFLKSKDFVAVLHCLHIPVFTSFLSLYLLFNIL